eukprot:jgi/Mesvir1/24474/Mv21834-RA.1
MLHVLGPVQHFSYALLVLWPHHELPTPLLPASRHCVLPSVEQERAMGEELYRMILSEHKSEVLPPNHPAVRRLHRVATEICRQAVIQNPDCEHLKDMRWEFNVIQSKEANAFVLPGGKVVVFSSLLHAFNDDELAAVVAHEVGHAVARHNAESLTSRSLINLLKLVLFAVTGIHPGGVGTLLDIGLTLPFSRRQELEADLIGLLLMASACFNPYGAASAHKKLGKMAKDPGVPSFLSTHPHTEERIKQLTSPEAMARAMQMQQLYCQEPTPTLVWEIPIE